MKRAAVLMVILALALPVALTAQGRGRGMFGDDGFGPAHRLGFLARQLDLTEQQKADVKRVLEAEKSLMEPVMTQLRENREALKKTTEDGQFNEAQVTSLAEKQGDLMAQMIVSRHRVQSQIWQLLTPEQREKADQLRKQAGHRGARGMGRRGAPPER